MGRVVVLFALLVTLVTAQRRLFTRGRRWDTHEVHIRGPILSETGTPNPFFNFRLDCRFTHQASGVSFSVPGFFAADGRAAHTSATRGRVWIVRFTPSRTGRWVYRVRFVRGFRAAITGRGRAVKFEGSNTGRFWVRETTVKWPDLRSHGRLQYVGQRYFRYSDGHYMLKLGTNTPENLLGYADFDKQGKYARHHYWGHVKDWRRGDPTWGGRKNRGKGMIGAINYLHKQGVNSLFAMLMTVKGDSRGDVHPWISQTSLYRFDVSKLEQWQIVFAHASRKGLALNLAFLETENEALFEHVAGKSRTRGFADARKLFYREMIARFAHNLGFTMTLGEENGWNERTKNGGGKPWGSGNTDVQRAEFTYFLRAVDPYDSPILVHTFPPNKTEVYDPLLSGNRRARVESASLQMGRMQSTHWETKHWLAQSERAGRQWVVSADEFGGGTRRGRGGVPLARQGFFTDAYRAQFAWGNVMAGGSGFELFSASVDQELDDFRQFHAAWGEFSRVRRLFMKHRIPFWAMNNDNTLVSMARKRGPHTWMYCLAKRGEVYVIYSGRDVVTPQLDLRNVKGRFEVRWFSPRRWETLALQQGGRRFVYGGNRYTKFGNAPRGRNKHDWVIVVSRQIPFDTRAGALSAVSPRDLIPGALTLGRKETFA